MQGVQKSWNLFLLDHANRVAFREVFGNRQRDLSARRPFGAAHQGGHETDTVHAGEIVAHRRVEDPALAITQSPNHRLMVTGAALGLVGIGRGEQVHLTYRPPEPVIKFIGGMHPFLRHVFGDWVLGVANDDGESLLRAMAGARPLALLDALLLSRRVENKSAAEIVVAPAEANHLVVLFPAAEGVVGSMDDDEALAVLEPSFQRGLEIRGPLGAVIVTENDIVVGEVGREWDGIGNPARFIAGFQVGRNGNRKPASLLDRKSTRLNSSHRL